MWLDLTFSFKVKSVHKLKKQMYFHQEWVSQQHGNLHHIKIWDVFKLMEQENQQHVLFIA